MHDILNKLRSKYSEYGMSYTDHYTEVDMWPTKMHFHVQFSTSAKDKPFTDQVKTIDINLNPVFYNY